MYVVRRLQLQFVSPLIFQKKSFTSHLPNNYWAMVGCQQMAHLAKFNDTLKAGLLT